MSRSINSTVVEFAERFNLFKTENRVLIAALEDVVEEHLDAVDETLDDYAADLKSTLGSDAANNEGDDENAQESAISEAEAWVTDNVSNGNLEDRIAAVLWLEGAKSGEEILRKRLPALETEEQNSSIKVYVLPAREDIANFEAGQRPTNLLVREFANEAELTAYKEGIDCIEDEFDEIDGLNVVGCKVTFTRETDEDDDADVTELIFDTEGEAKACHEGIGDAEGMHAPLVVESEDEGYERLAAYEAEGPEAAFAIGQRFTFQPGDQVVCNGYPGSVARMYSEGMVEVRLPGGIACVPASYPDCYPRG